MTFSLLNLLKELFIQIKKKQRKEKICSLPPWKINKNVNFIDCKTNSQLCQPAPPPPHVFIVLGLFFFLMFITNDTNVVGPYKVFVEEIRLF